MRQGNSTWVSLGLFLAPPRAPRSRFSTVPFFSLPKLYLSLPVVFAPDPCPSSRKQEFIQISELPIVPLLSQWCLFLSDEGGTSAMAPVQSRTWWAL